MCLICVPVVLPVPECHVISDLPRAALGSGTAPWQLRLVAVCACQWRGPRLAEACSLGWLCQWFAPHGVKVTVHIALFLRMII